MAIVFSSGTLSAPTKLLQVQQTVISSRFTNASSNNSWVSMSGFSRSITTIGSNSKLLITVNMGIVKPDGNTVAFKFQRNGSDVAIGDADGNRVRAMFRATDQGTDTAHADCVSFSFIDQPGGGAGSSYTYQLYFNHEYSGTLYVNRNISYSNASSAESSVTTSMIQIQEIAP